MKPLCSVPAILTHFTRLLPDLTIIIHTYVPDMLPIHLQWVDRHYTKPIKPKITFNHRTMTVRDVTNPDCKITLNRATLKVIRMDTARECHYLIMVFCPFCNTTQFPEITLENQFITIRDRDRPSFICQFYASTL